jgi:hypothetical protein
MAALRWILAKDGASDLELDAAKPADNGCVEVGTLLQICDDWDTEDERPQHFLIRENVNLWREALHVGLLERDQPIAVNARPSSIRLQRSYLDQPWPARAANPARQATYHVEDGLGTQSGGIAVSMCSIALQSEKRALAPELGLRMEAGSRVSCRMRLGGCADSNVRLELLLPWDIALGHTDLRGYGWRLLSYWSGQRNADQLFNATQGDWFPADGPPVDVWVEPTRLTVQEGRWADVTVHLQASAPTRFSFAVRAEISRQPDAYVLSEIVPVEVLPKG